MNLYNHLILFKFFIILFINIKNYYISNNLKNQYKFSIFVQWMTNFVNKEARKAGAKGIIQTGVWSQWQSNYIHGDGGLEYLQTPYLEITSQLLASYSILQKMGLIDHI